MRTRIEAWKAVVEGLKVGEYGAEGGALQGMVETWRDVVMLYRLPLQRRVLQRRLKSRHKWLMSQQRYGDGTPIPARLPF